MPNTFEFLAQAQTGYEQTEYMVAIGLTVAMVVLGLVAVCAPRFRKKHFIEPEETEEDNKSRRKK